MVIYKSTLSSIPIPNIDLVSFLFQPNEFTQSKDLDKPVTIDGETGRSLSWNQIRDKATYLATGWNQNVGLKKGDIVAVFAPNQYDHVILYLSLLGAKCTISPGNPAYTEAEFEHQITNSQAVALVTVPVLLPIFLKVADKVGIPRHRIFLFGDTEVDGCRPFYSISGSTPITLPLTGIDGYNDTAFINYSSGTTGLAKGVMLTHKNFIAQILQTVYGDPEEEHFDDDVVLGFLPFYHIYGLTVLVLNAYYKALPVVIMSRFDLELMCKLIQKYKITLVSIVPPVAVLLAKHPIVSNYALNSVRLLGCGAAPLSKEHIRLLSKRIPAQLVQGYGMTETTSGIISQRINSGGVAGSIGILSANIECKIMNEKGEELGDDQEGEFLFRGPSIMKGYFNNPKANAETFTEDGWMRTGDVGKFDSKSGEFFILDRIKELIKYKGYQVAPAELEAILMSIDLVADCCVVGYYDEAQATELPRAYIVLQPSIEANARTAQLIEEYVAKSVSTHKKLRGGIQFVEAIPKSPSGKILRRQVKDWVKKEQKEMMKARL
ncbi:uncharacterized protein BX663DRAFT_427751 [Cokeromyces recurvatus]|uniref:uncharacterized protein n=1 Tax=Cokeromyces recurvatus TaxID=90255 RepID=UPI00221E699E|nr:uncharacterized protein BX663DRAFT_427751 [Cokeromyces recurvatus]KAI7906316.1 hypothetical protein BX663DRAFT_427751 [Cokeromyces recurvatus]